VQDEIMQNPWLPASLVPDMNAIIGPLSIIIFVMVLDALSRLAPALRDHTRPLLGLPHSILEWLYKKLARNNRTSVELQKRGLFALMVIGVVGIGVAWVGQYIILHARYGHYVMWFFVWQWSAAWTIARLVLALDKPDAKQFKQIVTRHRLAPLTILPDKADAATFYRATIEILAISLVHGLFAPLTYALLAAALGYPAFYGAVFGVMGALLASQRPVDATQRQFSYILQNAGAGILFLPSRLAGLMVVLASLFTPKANFIKAFSTMVRDGHRYQPYSLGWVMAAISGAFGIAFSLPGGAWLGGQTGTARIDKSALWRALWLHGVTILLLLLVLCAVLLLAV
jgi:cobalamin biosynthesis protein CobD/CbiB